MDTETMFAVIDARLNELGIWSRSAQHETYERWDSPVNYHWRFEQSNVLGSISYQEFDGTPTLWLRVWGRSYLTDGTELPGTEVHSTYRWTKEVYEDAYGKTVYPQGWSAWEYEHD